MAPDQRVIGGSESRRIVAALAGMAGEPRASVLSGEEWKRAFVEQYRENRERVQRYARRVARSVANAGGSGGDYYADELLQDALGDTVAGVLRWDPAVTTLELHLISRIRSRARDERRRLRSVRHESIDEDPGDEDEGVSVIDEMEGALAAPAEGAAVEHARGRLALLAEKTHDDPELHAVLEAIADGAEGRDQILSATGLSGKDYRNARVRLSRLGDDLFGPARRVQRRRRA